MSFPPRYIRDGQRSYQEENAQVGKAENHSFNSYAYLIAEVQTFVTGMLVSLLEKEECSCVGWSCKKKMMSVVPWFRGFVRFDLSTPRPNLTTIVTAHVFEQFVPVFSSARGPHRRCPHRLGARSSKMGPSLSNPCNLRPCFSRLVVSKPYNSKIIDVGGDNCRQQLVETRRKLRDGAVRMETG